MNVKMLSVVWPQGIPTQDYAKLVDLMKAAPVEAKRGRPKKKDGARERIVSLLSTGPATIGELAQATGYTRASIWLALEQVAVKVGTRENASGFGIPANVYALRKEAKR